MEATLINRLFDNTARYKEFLGSCSRFFLRMKKNPHKSGYKKIIRVSELSDPFKLF